MYSFFVGTKSVFRRLGRFPLSASLTSQNRTMRNVEIKAKIRDREDIISKAKILSNSQGFVIKQHDTFFKVPIGRLKLRKFEDGSGDLIYYDRPDTEGPKLSNFSKTAVCKEDVQGIAEVLKNSNGVIGIIQKLRMLYLVGQTRVHIDNVNGLGDFMELEVVLNEDQSLEDGQKIANELMAKLGVQQDDLIAGAYLDMKTTSN
ncbi:uncharacterized protein LOC124308706 [Neodiprion virginianus]|uniref:uncharacterized protein LOC124308706 n=1 Tax=Neodiprion virginianus TaxID=2961670 RepID=UPI001EE72FA2|nr:uncharacterized protein LOC124308706 [Neodiprion virginianus]